MFLTRKTPGVYGKTLTYFYQAPLEFSRNLAKSGRVDWIKLTTMQTGAGSELEAITHSQARVLVPRTAISDIYHIATHTLPPP